MPGVARNQSHSVSKVPRTRLQFFLASSSLTARSSSSVRDSQRFELFEELFYVLRSFVVTVDHLLQLLAQRIGMETGKPDISGVTSPLERLLQESIAAVPLVTDRPVGPPFDLSHINFEVLIEVFNAGSGHTVPREGENRWLSWASLSRLGAVRQVGPHRHALTPGHKPHVPRKRPLSMICILSHTRVSYGIVGGMIRAESATAALGRMMTSHLDADVVMGRWGQPSSVCCFGGAKARRACSPNSGRRDWTKLEERGCSPNIDEEWPPC